MLTAIIDLLDGAKYLWEGEHHETKVFFRGYPNIYGGFYLS